MSRALPRVRQALACPFCRDRVRRIGAVACARPGCGAVYHRACWDECARDYGGCAVYGCGSTHAEELSGFGWFVKLARLVVAAAVFSGRVVTRARGSLDGRPRPGALRLALRALTPAESRRIARHSAVSAGLHRLDRARERRRDEVAARRLGLSVWRARVARRERHQARSLFRARARLEKAARRLGVPAWRLRIVRTPPPLVVGATAGFFAIIAHAVVAEDAISAQLIRALLQVANPTVEGTLLGSGVLFALTLLGIALMTFLTALAFHGAIALGQAFDAERAALARTGEESFLARVRRGGSRKTETT